MSQLVFDSIKKYFNDKDVKPTREQVQEIDSFLADDRLNALAVHRDERSANGLRFLIARPGGANGFQPNEGAVVFVKVASGSPAAGAPVTDDRVISEGQLIQDLRAEMSSSVSTHSGILNVMSRLHKHANLTSLMQAMKSDRTDLLARVLDWAEESLSIDNREEKETVDLITTLKAKERKMRAVIKVCESIFPDLETYPEARKNLKQLADELLTESNRLFREWVRQSSGIRFDKSRQCIEIDSTTQEPRVTFSYDLVRMSRQCKLLRCFGFTIPQDIADKEQDVRQFGSVARELREVVHFYCTVGDHILPSQKPIMIHSASQFTTLLESRSRISWDKEPEKLSLWLAQLRDFAKTFSSENKLLRQRHQTILRSVIKLFDLPVAKWKPVLNEVRTLVYETDERFSNTLSWKIHWDHQLYKILEYQFNDALLKADAWLGSSRSEYSASSATETFYVDLCFTGGRIGFQPLMEEIKVMIYSRIRKFLSLPQSFSGLVQSKAGQESIFTAIYARSFLSFPFLYSKAGHILKELQAVADRFSEWVALHDVLQVYGNNAAGLAVALQLDTVDDYKSNLLLLKTITQKFKKEFLQNEVACESANIVINISPIKTIVEYLLTEMDHLILKTLKERTESESRELRREAAALLERLEQQPKKVAELMEIETLIRKDLAKTCNNMTIRYTDLTQKASFMKMWSAKIAPDLSELSSMIDELQHILNSRDQTISSFRDLLQAGVESNLESLESRITVISKRWSNATPDVRSSQEFVTEIIHDTEQLVGEFEEANAAVNYFSLPQPGSFDAFAQLMQEVHQTDAKLSMIAEFESGLRHFLDMEWIICRNKLPPIEHYINRWQEDHCGPSLSSVINERIQEWKDLLPVLKLCRGECFAKTHWQSLISLLGFPDSINHHNLTLGNLFSVGSLLKSSRDQIRELNAQAVGEASVRETFSELEDFASNARFTLFDYEVTDGTSIKLIKDWRTILNQISESILTLQSVRSSDFFSNEFAERGDQWQSRLQALDSGINSLSTVQRKWAYLEPIYSKNKGPGVFADRTFSNISREFLDIMRNITSDTHVIRVLRVPNLDIKLKEIESVLVSCQKKLAVFMEESRNRFPRFYFLADDDLLLVLAGKTEISEAGLLKKLFNNTLVRLHFASGSNSGSGTESTGSERKVILAVESPEGEVVKLKKSVSTAVDQVETWLLQLEAEIRSSLQEYLFSILRSGKELLKEPLSSWEVIPSQVISMSQWVIFTRQVEEAIRSKGLRNLKSALQQDLQRLCSFQLERESIVTRIKVKSLILDTIHFLAVIEDLMDSLPRTTDDPKWLRCMRYYFQETGKQGPCLRIWMSEAVQEYSFEYLGCYGSAKLVHTPLTDRCYETCMQGEE